MKTQVQLFYLLLLLVLHIPLYSQVYYTQDFENFFEEWDNTGFDKGTVASCDSQYGYYANLYGTVSYIEATSPSLGTSNGLEVTLSYDYKVMDFNNWFPPLNPTLNSSNWGYFEVLYSNSPTGNFTILETIDTSNHIESAECATRTITFTPPAGEEVYIKIIAHLDDSSNDFYVILDNLNVIQELPDCTGTPIESSTLASTLFICDDADVLLSLSYNYDTNVNYQWQTSADGEIYTDVEGGNQPAYTAMQTEDTWYRAVITCDNSMESVTSTPVQVFSGNLNCLCDISFDGDVEPITRVIFAGIDNSTDISVNGSPELEDFTSLEPGEVTAGETYTISLEGNTNGEDSDAYFTVFIDFNQNGSLSDQGERFLAGLVSGSTGEDGQQALSTITIPENALNGVTRMRIIKLYNSYTGDSCSSASGLGHGQAEDYLLNITNDNCTTPPPIADDDQVLCGNPMVSDLNAEVSETGTLVWYADEEAQEPLADDTELIDGEIYFAAQVDGCESVERTAVLVTIIIVSDLTGEPIQFFEDAATVADLEVNGEDGAVIEWYASENDAILGEEALADYIPLVNNMHYYATQTIQGCKSEPFEVLVDITLSVNMFDNSSLTYYPNPVEEVLTISATTLIYTIEVYNLLGQQVLTAKAGAEDAVVNLSGLSAGTYMVKVMGADLVKIVKVVKE